MSGSGVMHIRDGMQQAAFKPLADWIREKSNFEMIRELGFFKTYLQRRAFGRWLKLVRRKHFLAVRNEIKSKLLLARPTFVGALPTP